ncbi:MAG: hypothetical protein DI538_15820 [Azospira oryzae]|nr:MAG: hypothetical protein DI538_15820 [Azospira oryzae]
MVNQLLGSLLLLTISLTTYAQKVQVDGRKKINGTNLYVKILGEGEPLLVVHGGPGLNQSYFMPHMNALAKKYKLIFYDQRASGQSALPSPDSVSLSFFVNDIEAIRKEIGADKINLFAHSWGAIPATSYAISYSQHVQTLIFCNPVPLSKEFDQEMRNAQLSKVTSEDSTSRAMIVGSPAFRKGDGDAYKKLLLLSFRNAFYLPQHFNELNVNVPSNYVEASKILYTGLAPDLAHYNYYDQLKSLSFPVLIIHGEADAIPLAASRKLQRSLPHSSLQVFSKSGHFAFIDEPRKFTKEISGFLHKH